MPDPLNHTPARKRAAGGEGECSSAGRLPYQKPKNSNSSTQTLDSSIGALLTSWWGKAEHLSAPQLYFTMIFYKGTEKKFSLKLMSLKNCFQQRGVLKLNPKFRRSSFPVASEFIDYQHTVDLNSFSGEATKVLFPSWRNKSCLLKAHIWHLSERTPTTFLSWSQISAQCDTFVICDIV